LARIVKDPIDLNGPWCEKPVSYLPY